jgi:prevent-host-death family protein
MEKVSVSALKNGLSAFLRKVRAGHSVIIYDRNVPIARLVRIEGGEGPGDRLAKLRSEGLTRPALRKLSAKRRRALRSPIAVDAAVVRALREDRDDDR